MKVSFFSNPSRTLLIFVVFFTLSTYCVGQSSRTKLVFTAYENGAANLYAADFDGGNRKTLLSHKLNPGTFGASVSPNGKLIAYQISSDPQPKSYDLYVMNADGTGRRKIFELSTHFSWTPDSRSLIYPTGKPPEWYECPSLYPMAPDWHRVDILSLKDEVLAESALGLQGLAGWIGNDRALFMNPEPFVELREFDGATKKLQKIELPSKPYFITGLSVNPRASRIVASYNLPDFRCVFYASNSARREWIKIVAEDYQRCENISWERRRRILLQRLERIAV